MRSLIRVSPLAARKCTCVQPHVSVSSGSACAQKSNIGKITGETMERWANERFLCFCDLCLCFCCFFIFFSSSSSLNYIVCRRWGRNYLGVFYCVNEFINKMQHNINQKRWKQQIRAYVRVYRLCVCVHVWLCACAVGENVYRCVSLCAHTPPRNSMRARFLFSSRAGAATTIRSGVTPVCGCASKEYK